MYKSIRRKETIKNVVYIGLILLVAVVSTYLIYDKFVEERKIDSSSEILEVTYRDNSGHKLAITKVTPLTDSVGLSTTNYGVTLSNNLTEKVNYIIMFPDDILTDDIDEIITNNNIEKIYFDPLTTLSIENKNSGKDYITIMKENLDILKQELYIEQK